MIIEYHKPEELDEALKLLARETPKTLPLGGGIVLNAPNDASYAVVDLQQLGLDAIEVKGKTVKVGATATLQALLDTPDMPAALKNAIEHEATRNLREVGTVAGTLVAADGRSPFATVMQALDATLTLQPGDTALNIGELLPLRAEQLKQKLITSITFSTAPKLAYEFSARSPADLPIVAVAVAQWGSGRTRVAVGGYGKAPQLALDGRDASGAAEAAENIFFTAEDEWATAEYRKDVVKKLISRCLESIVE